MEYRKLRVIISGGGTGGHIFPAVSIAKTLKEVNPETEILFVGAEGKMEMEKVPAEGFRIVGLPITGLQRQLNLRNIVNDVQVPIRYLGSIRKARRIIREFKPEIAVGVGGYASAPLLMAATRMKLPALIQEQNGFAGLTNKLLANKVQSICVAYEGMERFFPADKIVMSGNPIRPSMHPYTGKERLEGLGFYGFSPEKKHILIVGGSLGSGTLNKAMKAWIEAGCPGGEDVEVLCDPRPVPGPNHAEGLFQSALEGIPRGHDRGRGAVRVHPVPGAIHQRRGVARGLRGVRRPVLHHHAGQGFGLRHAHAGQAFGP